MTTMATMVVADGNKDLPSAELEVRSAEKRDARDPRDSWDGMGT